MTVILITGGARSGKSRHAEVRAQALGPDPVYVATCPPAGEDAEMAARIDLHRDRRGPEWRLVEEPLDLAGALRATDGGGPRLVDCLTLWLSNLMYHGRDWRAEAEALVPVLAAQAAPVVLVTNEVGLGIVPDSALARAFRDAQGTLNQMIARAADEVEFVVAGLPMRVK
ncbi:bifunctional adenosylcobinamide kinase/adenosylcobinamide-phosphate guanylyltransferase [Frigidibacter sp. MR17.24]|uniref:bifunctional adenosylcobinamide kinase/adenosylcobinamide-phosphate guanylyltransferase n=1 Tax=Frigidibacter sp. MR17.24 TaxID=3127345 RepID=UPI003012F460